MAGKSSLDHFRKDDAQNRPYATAYYNAEVHQAAFVAPEFLRNLPKPR